nr:CcoQ/FixQ family Cbb3-type cytochrome c oxidase assembly chaperone [Achromobacter sp. UMC71]
MAFLSAIVTAISMATFFGIVWWACSRGRQRANSESALLPFALPDEFGPAQQDGADRS